MANDFISDEDFVPDDFFQPDQEEIPPTMPNPEAQERARQAAQYDALQAKYGGPTQQLEAAGAGLARGATFGLSDLALTKSGLVSPQTLSGLQAANPTISGASAIGGAGATGALTGGTSILGAAAIGGLFGAGNAVSEYALGDTDLNAQKIATHIGLGILIGGGAGLIFKGIGMLPAMFRRGTSETAEAAQVLTKEAGPVVDGPGVTGVKPTSFEEMAKKVEESTKYGGQTTELPQKAVLEDALSRVEMQNPVHPAQLDSLASQGERDAYNTVRELPGKEGDIIRNYEGIQKGELTSKIDETIKGLSPEVEPIADAVQGGNRAIKAFTDQYQAEKKALGPLFEKFDDIGMNLTEDLADKPQALEESIEGASKYLKIKDGNLEIDSYKPSMPFSKAAHDAMSDIIEAANDKEMTLGGIRNIRNSIGDRINFNSSDREVMQLSNLRKMLMNYMQDAVDEQAPELKVRDLFKRYAINEQERQVIEKTFGASVGSKEFGAISKIKPEMVGDRIFGNTANVKAAKQILEPKDFNQILSNWLSEARAAATDKGVFSSNKFGSFLRRNQDALREAFSDNPQALQRLNDVTTISRILPDAPSINPSGTAKTLIGGIAKAGLNPLEQARNILSVAKDYVKKQSLLDRANSELAGTADKATRLGGMSNIIKKVDEKISDEAKAVLNKGTKAMAISGSLGISDKEYKDITQRIQSFHNNPKSMIDHMSNMTQHVHSSAPGIIQGLHNTIVNGVSFLGSKIPQPTDQKVLSPNWEPSKTEKASFKEYYRAVNDPLSILDDMKHGHLSDKSIEACQAVYPQFLNEIRAKIMENMDPEKAKNLPYSKKVILSKLIGEPLENGIMPQAIISNQAALNGPNLSQQSTPKQGRKTGQGGLKQLNMSSRVRTRTEAEELGE